MNKTNPFSRWKRICVHITWVAAAITALPAAAVTPVEVDKLLASDGLNHDQAGYSVAIDHDTAVIGAPGSVPSVEKLSAA